MNTKTYIKFYLINVANVFFLFLTNFVFKFIEPNYFICNTINDYKFFNITISYPISCDQESYYSAIRNLSTLFTEGYVYQGRPLYITVNNLISNSIDFISFNNITDFDIAIHISIILLNIFVVTLSSILFLKILNKDLSNNIFTYFLISLVLCASPLNKWGIFDPSNQLWTLLIITFNTYLITKKDSINYKTSLLVGCLVLIHRIFIVGYVLVFLILLIEKILKFNVKDFSHIFKMLTISILPFVLYNLYIFIFENQIPYDENSSHYGQFIWLPLYLFTSKRFEGGWHCMEIPNFLTCYLVDNFQLIFYLIVPLLFVIITNPLKAYRNNVGIEKLIKFCALIYLFYSLIGWYPPIRFSYYSIGNLIILLNIFLLLNYKDKILKILHLFSVLSFMIFLNHWNYEGIIDFNIGIIASIIIFLVYLINYFFSLNKKQKTNEKNE